MLNIFSKKHIPVNSRLIYDVVLEYDDIMSRNYDKLRNDKIVPTFLKVIDKSTMSKDGALVTPFGTSSLFNCSTGVKAAIVAYYYKDQPSTLTNICECGENVIRLLSKLNIDLYTYSSIYGSVGFSDDKVRFNGKIMTLREVTAALLREMD